MRRLMRRVGVYVWHTTACIAIVAIILTFLWATLYAVSVHRRRNAKRLLQRVAALTPKESDASVLRQFSNDFGGEPRCDRDMCTYEISEAFALGLSGRSPLLRRTEWDYVGLRPWQVTVHLKTANGRVTGSSFDVLVGRGRGWLYSESPLSGNMWAWLWVSVRSSAEGFEQLVRLERSRQSTIDRNRPAIMGE